MRVLKMIKELKKYNPNAKVNLHHINGNNAISVIENEENKQIVCILDNSDNNVVSQTHEYLTVLKLIEELQKHSSDAEVKIHQEDGNNVLFIVQLVEREGVVWIEDKTDSDLAVELETRFKYASESDIDELDFFMDLIETGFTLEDIENNLPDRYEYVKEFCENHALI